MEFQPPVWESLDGSPVPDGMGLEEYLSTRSENHGTPTRAAAHLAEGCFVRENGDWLYVDSIDWHEDGVTTALIPVNKPSRKTTLQYPRRERVETVSKYPEDLSREMAWTQTTPASDVDVLVEDPNSHDDPLAAFIAETVESVAVEFIGSDRAPPRSTNGRTSTADTVGLSSIGSSTQSKQASSTRCVSIHSSTEG